MTIYNCFKLNSGNYMHINYIKPFTSHKKSFISSDIYIYIYMYFFGLLFLYM